MSLISVLLANRAENFNTCFYDEVIYRDDNHNSMTRIELTNTTLREWHALQKYCDQVRNQSIKYRIRLGYT